MSENQQRCKRTRDRSINLRTQRSDTRKAETTAEHVPLREGRRAPERRSGSAYAKGCAARKHTCVTSPRKQMHRVMRAFDGQARDRWRGPTRHISLNRAEKNASRCTPPALVSATTHFRFPVAPQTRHANRARSRTAKARTTTHAHRRAPGHLPFRC